VWRASQRWKKETEKAQTEIPLLLIFCYKNRVSDLSYNIKAAVMAKVERPEKYNSCLNELDSLGISTLQKNLLTVLCQFGKEMRPPFIMLSKNLASFNRLEKLKEIAKVAIFSVRRRILCRRNDTSAADSRL
jgi:hypothetical protein